jgi:RNA polymerase sigma factor (sigma-70 family)
MKSLAHAITVSVADSSVPDGDLLARFADTGDAAAFELLVRRHAELVWRVCRSELPADRHSAEDAFQATFLVLARKAGAVREPSAAGFLFRVARNAALRARKRVGRVAEALADLPVEAHADSVEVGECSAAVVAEVERLPDKFRLPVLLCFFEDCTHAEAADRLGWAVGTVASRLARAKDRLRDRLTRKGFALPAVLTAAAVSGAEVRAAVAVATTPSAVPAGVSELTREVLTSMWNAKAKLVGGGVLATLLVGVFGLTMLTAGQKPGEPRAKEQPKARPPEKPDDAELKKLQGVWRVTRIETADRGVAPAKEIAGMRWEIVGGTIFGQDSLDEPRRQQATFIVDPAKSPKQIALTAVAGPKDEVGKKMEGIYELNDNTLRLCFAEPGKARPTEFKVVKKGDGGMIELERIPETIKSVKDLAGEWRVTTFDNEGKSKLPVEGMTAEFHRDVAWLIAGGTNADRYAVDLNAEKGLIDLTEFRTGDPGKPRQLLGRFTWKDDKLTLTLGEPGKPRPAEATSGKNVTVIVLERGAKR